MKEASLKKFYRAQEVSNNPLCHANKVTWMFMHAAKRLLCSEAEHGH